jgi:hypothetical protein
VDAGGAGCPLAETRPSRYRPRAVLPELVLASALALGPSAPAAAAPEGPGRFLPCTPGLLVRSTVHREGRLSAHVEVRVVGPGAEPRTCVSVRRTSPLDGPARVETIAYERLEDRVLFAGDPELALAFRPPILKSPLRPGAHWRFDLTEFRVEAVGETVRTPAGRFEGCVRVREHQRADPPRPDRVLTYAPGVGLIRAEIGAERIEASAVLRPR